MFTLRQLVVTFFAAGSVYLVGTYWWTASLVTPAQVAYAQQPTAPAPAAPAGVPAPVPAVTNAEQQELIAGAEKLSRAFRSAASTVSPSVVRIDALVRVEPRRRATGGGGFPGIPEELRGLFGDDMFRDFEAPQSRSPLPRSPQPRLPQSSSPQSRTPQQSGPNDGAQADETAKMQKAGIGSGFIVSASGYILTNNHVVEGAEGIKVQLSDGRSLDGKLIGRDDKSDVAVVKIEAQGLIPARLGDSGLMDVGDWVIAVGSPFELDQSVTAGIISATNRSVEILDYEDFLQTDAAINPGNSGGPLVNLRGEVIGINTAINSRSGSNAGVGFAIPSNLARLVMDNLIEHGRVVRGFIGAGLATLTPSLAEELQLTDVIPRGVVVQTVSQNGPAAKGGLRPGDVIVRVDGQPIRSGNALRNHISLTKPGRTVRLDVNRNKQNLDVVVQVEELTDQKIAEFSGRVEIEELGISLSPMTPQIAKILGIEDTDVGAVVVEVKQGRGARVGLEAGDIILEVNGQEITEPAQVAKLLRENQRGLRMVIRRGETLLLLRSGG